MLNYLKESIVGIQINRGDHATVRNVHVKNAKKKSAICKLYEFQNEGRSDPKFIRNGDGKDEFCEYNSSDVTIE